jgi:hypothetical protein
MCGERRRKESPKAVEVYSYGKLVSQRFLAGLHVDVVASVGPVLISATTSDIFTDVLELPI